MKPTPPEDNAALAVFGLLDLREQAAFAGAMREDPALRALSDDLREAGALLACCTDGPPPPPNLKQRLLDRVATGPAAQRPAPGRWGWQAWAGWLTAACLAVVALWLGQLHLSSSEKNNLLQQAQAFAETSVQSLRYQLEAERIIKQHEQGLPDALTTLVINPLRAVDATTAPAAAVAVWNPAGQEGLLAATHLPPLPPDRDYQVWIIAPHNPLPVDGGVFHVESGQTAVRYRFKAAQPVHAVQRFAVSLERRGGAPQAEGPMVLWGD